MHSTCLSVCPAIAMHRNAVQCTFLAGIDWVYMRSFTNCYRPANPLQVLGEYLIQKSEEVEGDSKKEGES